MCKIHGRWNLGSQLEVIRTSFSLKVILFTAICCSAHVWLSLKVVWNEQLGWCSLYYYTTSASTVPFILLFSLQFLLHFKIDMTFETSNCVQISAIIHHSVWKRNRFFIWILSNTKMCFPGSRPITPFKKFEIWSCLSCSKRKLSSVAPPTKNR